MDINDILTAIIFIGYKSKHQKEPMETRQFFTTEIVIPL